MLSFRPLVFEDQTLYRSYSQATPQLAAEYTFINLWAWNAYSDFEIAVDGPLLWLKQHCPRPTLLAPVGDWRTVDWRKILEERFPEGGEFADVPDVLAGLWKAAFSEEMAFEEDRPCWEYLYKVEDLVKLSGNRLMRRRNRLHQFNRLYDSRYLRIEGEMIPRIQAFQQEWLRLHVADNPSLEEEDEAIRRVLSNWESLKGVLGGAIEVGSELVAYTIGEALPSAKTLVIHFEKGLERFKSSYQAINQQFLAHEGKDFLWVNREEDMGDPGLRQAKLSYCPKKFLRKYRVFWHGHRNGGDV